jgi:hypothetical protein
MWNRPADESQVLYASSYTNTGQKGSCAWTHKIINRWQAPQWVLDHMPYQIFKTEAASFIYKFGVFFSWLDDRKNELVLNWNKNETKYELSIRITSLRKRFISKIVFTYKWQNIGANSPRIWYASGPGSSVSIVSGYRLDYRAIEVQSPAEAKGFLL